MKLPFGNAQDAHLGTDLLSGYLDNQIASGERLRVEQHLHSCAACRAELTSLRQTVALLHALPRVPVPRAFTLSEAQVGVRRGATAPWVWGAARALGAVAALLVVAALAVTLLQRTGQPGITQVARAPQPAAAPVAPSAAQPTSAESSAPQTSAPQPQDTAVQQPPAAAIAPTQPRARTSAPATSAAAAAQGQAPQAKAAAPTKPAQAPSATAKSATTGSARSTQPPAAAGASLPSATAANSATPASALALAPDTAPAPTQEQRSLMFAAPATGPAPAAPGGRGGAGGGGAGGAGGAPSGEGAPNSGSAAMPVPALAPLGATLPSNAGVVYTDHQSLTAIDSRGTRSLVQTPGISVPTISADRTWVGYRVQHDSYAEIWAVRWDGSQAHLVASERDFPGHNGAPTGPVLIERMEWIPGGHTLGLTVAVSNAGNPDDTRRELWSAKADGRDLRYVLELGPTGHVVFSPDGKAAALLSRGTPGQEQGKLSLFGTDGSGQHTALEFPANVNSYGYESQLAWWPDSSGLWAGIPDATALFPESASIGLYRVPVRGSAQLVGHVTGLDTFWSPDGKQLAYTEPVGGSPDNRELVLSGADGGKPQNYSPVASGSLAEWSTDSKHFTFYSSDEWFEGGIGQQPQQLGPASNMAEVHWVGPEQLLYLQDTGATWLLVSQTIGGKTSGLVPVPKDADVDMTR